MPVGDSAGAALSLECLYLTHDPSSFIVVTAENVAEPPTEEPLPRPAGLVLISPLVTDQTDSASWKANVKYDYITQRTAKVIKREYLPQVLDAPIPFLEVAKENTGFKKWMPHNVLVLMGGKEVLLDDGTLFARKLKKDGLNVELVVEEDLVHDWFLVREVVKDKQITDRADKLFARFISRAVNDRSSSQVTIVEEKIPTQNDDLYAELIAV